MRVRVGDCFLELVQGDITTQEVDAIVNAANSALAGGGGVDGAIHRAAGPGLMEETQRRYPDGCPTGSAVITTAGRLHAKYVLHAVGPVWDGGHQGERELLQSAYTRCLQLAREHHCHSVAFPALSAGAYGYPADLAAEHALQAVSQSLLQSGRPHTVRFVLYDQGMYGGFARALEEICTSENRQLS